MAGEQYEIYESGTAAALAEAQLALLDSKADKTGIYSTLTAGGTTPDTITDAMLVQTGGVLERVSNLNDDLDNITIEGYEHELVELELTITDGGYINYRGEFDQLESYMYAETECRPNTTYLITSTKGTGARMYVVLDVNRSVIDVAPSETSSLVTVEYETPSAARYLIVNCAKPYSPSICTVDTLAFVKVTDTDESVSVSHGDGDAYTIHGTRFSYLVNLSGSANRLFKFERIDVEGISGVFKTCGDDITPVTLDVGYVGANHGYYYVYDCVATGHGLTEADIGRTSTDGTNTWVLIQVKDADNIVVGCYRASKWYRLTLTAPTTLDFGTSFTVELATRSQLYPSVKNGEVKFVDSDKTKCLIMETYDIIEVGTGIDALMENVGSNTNESIAELSDSAITVRNLYEFHANGSIIIYQNLKVLKDYITITSYGGVQSQAFGTMDNYMVPQTTKRVPSPSGSATFDRETWSDQTVPPVLYIQIDNAPNSYTKAMLLGYITPNRNADISSMAGNMSSARKMYPYAVQPISTVDAGKTYSFVSFRVPAFKSEYSQDVPIVSYTHVYDDIYLFLYSVDAVNTSVTLPEFMWGKRCEVYMSDGMTCETTNIIDSVDVRSSANYGSIVLKLSD